MPFPWVLSGILHEFLIEYVILSGIHFVLVLSTLRNQSLFSFLVCSCLLKWWVAALRLQVIRFSFSLNGGNDSSLHPLSDPFFHETGIGRFHQDKLSDWFREQERTLSPGLNPLKPLGRTSQLSYQLFSDQHITSGCDSSLISALYVLMKQLSLLLLAHEHHALFLLQRSSEVMINGNIFYV